MGARSPHRNRNAKRSPEKMRKQRRGTIRWMVPLNAFADPQEEWKLKRRSLLRSWDPLRSRIGCHCRQIKKDLPAKGFSVSPGCFSLKTGQIDFSSRLKKFLSPESRMPYILVTGDSPKASVFWGTPGRCPFLPQAGEENAFAALFQSAICRCVRAGPGALQFLSHRVRHVPCFGYHDPAGDFPALRDIRRYPVHEGSRCQKPAFSGIRPAQDVQDQEGAGDRLGNI